MGMLFTSHRTAEAAAGVLLEVQNHFINVRVTKKLFRERNNDISVLEQR